MGRLKIRDASSLKIQRDPVTGKVQTWPGCPECPPGQTPLNVRVKIYDTVECTACFGPYGDGDPWYEKFNYCNIEGEYDLPSFAECYWRGYFDVANCAELEHFADSDCTNTLGVSCQYSKVQIDVSYNAEADSKWRIYVLIWCEDWSTWTWVANIEFAPSGDCCGIVAVDNSPACPNGSTRPLSYIKVDVTEL